MKQNSFIITILALFTSFSTLFCCALPIILVFFGLGAVSSSLISNFSLITILAEHSAYLFMGALLLLGFSGYLLFVRPNSCPIDPKYAKICLSSKKFSKIIWLVSVIILIIAIFFKYILILLI
ncbi:MAG: hypothetical protein HON42_03095 [Alphaproteobacteria bacterium]|jgi:hypothetical protein|nr:hypothetical protein [Alphaproteobacteria bacterium]